MQIERRASLALPDQYVMFHRDPGAEDLTADSSDQTFAWPPPGFRTRPATHFGRTAATENPSASFSQHPHRKSSDQVIQSLRDELDKHRQMFFDRLAPQWESSSGTQRVRPS